MDAETVASMSTRRRKRRPLVLTLCAGAIVMVALLVSITSLALAAAGFPDVPSGHQYYAAITDLADRGIISGKTDGKFYPADPVTRQQFAKMIVGTGGYPVSEANVCPFTDVLVSGPGDFYPDNFVAVCAANGITLGKTETTFDPIGNITRYQVISMVVRAADNLQPGLLAPPPSGFGTWSGDPTHGSNAARAEYNGLLAGLSLASLNPYGNMTRGEVAQVLHNLLGKMGTGPATTYTLAVSVAGTGSGTVTKTPDQTTFAAGSTVVLTATAATGSIFMGWSGDAAGDTNSLTVTMDSNKTIVATFNTATVLYPLSTSVPGGGGTITKSPNQPLYPSGSSVVLTAVPGSGYTFHHWAGDAAGTANPITVVVDSYKSVQAVFVPAVTYTLSIAINPGQGTITRNPAKSAYSSGETVVLTATPAAGYTFSSWSMDASGTANPLTVTMDSNKTIRANFAQLPTHSLTTEVANGYGMVLRSPNKTIFYEGESVTLTAVPSPGYHFVRWWGSVGSTSNPITFAMNANKHVKVDFAHD